MQVFGQLELSSNSFRTKVFVVFLVMCRYQATDVAGSWTNEDRHFIDVHRSSVIFRPPRTKPISIRRVMVLWPQDSINISVLPSQLKKTSSAFLSEVLKLGSPNLAQVPHRLTWFRGDKGGFAVWAASPRTTRKATATLWGTWAHIPPLSHYTRALE